MSWNSVALGDVCSIVNGGTPKSEVSEYWNGDLNWITPKEMGKLNSREISSTERKITEKGMKNSSARLLPVNSVILSSRAPIGHLAINKELMATNQGCKGLVPAASLDFEYLYHFLSYSKETLNDMGTGATFKELSGGKLATLKIPFPPLATQKKIVAKLDAIFAEIDKATAAAEKNAKNAEALFSQILNELETKYDGIVKELGNCAHLLSGFAFKSNEYTNDETDIPLLRGDNLSPKKIDFSEAKRFDKNKFAEYSKYSLDVNDIVLGMDRPLISTGLRVAQVQTKDLPSLLVQRVMRLRCNKDVNSDFLFYLLNSSNFIRHLVGEQTGLGVPHVSGKTISSFQVKIPNFETQTKIASKLASIVERLNFYRTTNKSILNNWTLYKQSILNQAFSGGLVKG